MDLEKISDSHYVEQTMEESPKKKQRGGIRTLPFILGELHLLSSFLVPDFIVTLAVTILLIPRRKWLANEYFAN